MEEKRVLGKLLEDHLGSRGSAYVVESADSVQEAVDRIALKTTDLIVSDHDGADGIDGLELLEGIAESDVPVRTLLIASRKLEGHRSEALRLGCDTYVVKPYPVSELLELVYNMLQSPQGFSGRVIGLKLEDLIQMFCFRKDSTLIFVDQGDKKGRLYVHQGEIIHAECESLSGIDAAYEILGWKSGEFYSQVILNVPEKSIFEGWHRVLLEGMRQKDVIEYALTPSTSAAPIENDAAVESEAPAADAPTPEAPLQVMIVDDSRMIRRIVQELIQSDPALSVAGIATNGQEALAKIEELKPDLILLDWDMPVMKGSTTLMNIMIRSPCPVVILSGFVGGVGASPFDLLCLGAVDFLRKPQSKWRTDGRAADLIRRIKQAGAIKFERIRRVKIPSAGKAGNGNRTRTPSGFLSVFGSFTGGCADLIRIIPALPEDLPSAVIVIHDMQPDALSAFAEYLDARSAIEVRTVDSGTLLMDGVCYMHPATLPVEVVASDEGMTLQILTERPESGVFDTFLVSASKAAGKNVVAALLSGSGDKGVEGLKTVKQTEGITIVQDPQSSVDPRMAEAALREGVVDYKCSADALSKTFQNLLR